MAVRRWIRVDAGWSNSEWLALLPVGSRLAWIELLCYVKTAGTGGRVKALTPAVAEKRWDIPAKDVRTLVEAAVRGDALKIEDSDWLIVNWDEYQKPDETATERKRRQRRKVKNGHGGHGVTSPVTASQGRDPSLSLSVTKRDDEDTSVSPSSKMYDADFERFWKAYPKRTGGNPKASAKKAWNARRKGGAAVADIMSGLRRYTAFMEHTDKAGTEYVMHAATFLGTNRRWEEAWDVQDHEQRANHGGGAGRQGRGKAAPAYDPTRDRFKHLEG